MRVITKLLALTAICQWAVISFLITQQQNAEELFNTSNPMSAVSPFYKTEKDRGTLFPSKFRKMNLSYEKKQFEAIDYEGVAGKQIFARFLQPNLQIRFTIDLLVV